MGFLSIFFHSLFNSPEPISNKSPSSNTFSGTFSEYEQIYSIKLYIFWKVFQNWKNAYKKKNLRI